MENITFKFEDDRITDTEILQYQDFDQLIKMYQANLPDFTDHSGLWHTTAFTGSVIGVASAIFFTMNQFMVNKDVLTSRNIPVAIQDDSLAKASTPQQFSAPDKISNSNNPDKIDSVSASEFLRNKPAPKNMVPENKESPLITSKESTEPPAVEPEVWPEFKKTNDVYTKAVPLDGYPSLFRYFKKNLKYPEQSNLDKISGTVLLGFSINKEGRPINIQVMEGLNKEIDLEAIRLIKEMPLWAPAMVNNIPVTTRLVIPITFELESKKVEKTIE